MTRVPRVAELLLRLVAPAEDRDAVLGDLAEEYVVHIVPARGRAGARLWYWRQAVASLLPVLTLRLRRARARRRSHDKGDGPMRTLLHDLRYSLRLMAKNRGFTAVAALTLALGIGANATVFGVVDGMVLNPFPYPDPDGLVGIGTAYPRLGGELGFMENASPAEFEDVRTQSRTLRGVVAWDMGHRQLSADGGMPERLFSAFWWGDAFPTLGVRPRLGRGFLPEEIERSAAVAILSHRVWQSMFAGDPEIVGHTVHVNGNPYTVVGIMPPRALIYGTDLWLPMPVAPNRFPRGRRQFQILARLAPGATLEQANAELATIARRIEAEYGAEHEEYAGWRMVAKRWTEVNVQLMKPAALVLLGAVGFVLLLVCINVAGLLLSRAAGRRRETAVRAALGASRGRIVRQLLTESVVLSLVGGLGGVALAALGVRGFQALIAAMPVPVPGEAAMSARVLVYTAAVSLLVGMVFGAVPALHASRSDLQRMLNGDGAGATAPLSRQRIQRVFLAAEVALALALLVGGGLLVHSFVRMQRVEPGFDTANVLTMRLTLPWEKYRGVDITNFFERLVGDVAAVPGVVGATTGTQFPPIGFSRQQFRIRGREPASDDALPVALATIARHGYFETLGLPLLRGRTFTERDGPNVPFVTVINEEAARRYFPGEDPVGQRIRAGGADSDDPWMEIVGVVGTARNRGLDRPPEPEMFASLRQAEGWSNQLFLLVRTEVAPRAVLLAIREIVRSLDPDLPVYAIQTVDDAFATTVAPRRIATFALALLAAFALALAAIGVYGVASYAVTQRTQEIGVRMALGADRAQVRRLVVRQVLLPIGIGAAAGLGLALAAGRFMRGLLYEISGTDPATIGSVALVLAAVALLATYVPARRASRLDPVRALRTG